VSEESGAFELDRDVATLSGPDAVSFLHSQVSADVTSLDVGASTWSLLLEPNGKLTVWGRVTRTGDEELVFDVDAGWGEVAAARLRRFLLRVDLTIEVGSRRCLALRGPRSAPVVDLLQLPDDAFVAPVDWRGLPGVDVVSRERVDVPGELQTHGRDVLEVMRVEQGWPAMGRELDASTIPAEAGAWLIESSVSFTKGCYTGQELVARVHSRGSHTPRHLRGLVFDDSASPPEPGTPVLADGVERATVTSAAVSVRLGAPIAMAMLHRSVEPGATVDVDGSSATVVELPFS